MRIVSYPASSDIDKSLVCGNLGEIYAPNGVGTTSRFDSDATGGTNFDPA